MAISRELSPEVALSTESFSLKVYLSQKVQSLKIRSFEAQITYVLLHLMPRLGSDIESQLGFLADTVFVYD